MVIIGILYVVGRTNDTPQIPQQSLIVDNGLWQTTEDQDAMSDRKSFRLSLEGWSVLPGSSNTYRPILNISCSNSLDVYVYSHDDFFTKPLEYAVSYRIDKHDAVLMESWPSQNKASSPPDSQKFLSEISGGEKLIMDFTTPVDGITHRYEFELHGLRHELENFNKKCSSLQGD